MFWNAGNESLSSEWWEQTDNVLTDGNKVQAPNDGREWIVFWLVGTGFELRMIGASRYVLMETMFWLRMIGANRSNSDWWEPVQAPSGRSELIMFRNAGNKGWSFEWWKPTAPNDRSKQIMFWLIRTSFELRMIGVNWSCSECWEQRLKLRMMEANSSEC
jgi:hypothetical protein